MVFCKGPSLLVSCLVGFTLRASGVRITEEAAERKTVTLFRHGMSVGNAGIKGAMEVGDLFGYRDGILVKKGEQQAVDRAAMLDDALLARVANAEVILTSPLVRAMATAVIVWAEAWKLHRNSVPAKLPRFQVMRELIEKVQSDSERPGTNKRDPMKYVQSVADKYNKKLFDGASDALADLLNATGLQASYFRERTHQDESLCELCTGCTQGGTWQPEPQDGVCYLATQAVFRRRLGAEVPEANVMVVAHNGWLRYTFAAQMPSPVSDTDERAMENLRTGCRLINYLNNVGVVTASFDTAVGNFRDAHVGATAPGNASFPNSKLTSERFAPLQDLKVAKELGRLPQDAMVDRVYVGVRRGRGGFSKKVLVLSASQGVASLFEATRWGVPASSKKERVFLPLNDGAVELSSQGGNLLLTSPAIGTLTLKPDKDPQDLMRLFHKYVNVAAA